MVSSEKYIDWVVIAQKSNKSCKFQRAVTKWPTAKYTGLRHIDVEQITQTLVKIVPTPMELFYIFHYSYI